MLQQHEVGHVGVLHHEIPGESGDYDRLPRGHRRQPARRQVAADRLQQRHRHQHLLHQRLRITSYNVCYTKLLRGATALIRTPKSAASSALQRVRAITPALAAA